MVQRKRATTSLGILKDKKFLGKYSQGLVETGKASFYLPARLKNAILQESMDFT